MQTQAAVDSALCRTGKHSSEGYEALAALARRRRSHFKSKQEAAERFRSRPPFSAFHKDCFEEYVAHGLSEQAGVQQLALPYMCELSCNARVPYQMQLLVQMCDVS